MTVLEKIKILERYVAIDPSMIDPVIEMAIDKLLERETTRMGDMHPFLCGEICHTFRDNNLKGRRGSRS